ncbi:unnamed protein product [Candidula unifasciata]|uniref:D-isomer specific 2-hydroxyacid dehydrogenase NAD-binding domain-containing protein n=1 Tax=Candidula unifasciata TaxID=100452 RepID=A0A8S3Z9Q0_9EUPU|nr:unnamed protein product [Candidula unifasciata]
MLATHEETILSKTMANPSSYCKTQGSPLRDPSCRIVRRPVVYVTRRIPQEGLSVLLEVCNVKQWDSELVAPKGEILANVVGVDGILCLPSDRISAEVLDAAGPQLRVVATISFDSKHIDVEECHRRGVQVVTCCLRPTEILAELTISLALLTIKESQTELSFQLVNGKSRNVESLTWKKIAKMRFGVFGQTKLGKRVAKILRNIGISNVLIADVDTNNMLLQKSDVICVCGSQSENSSELFSRASLEKMKKDAIVIISTSQDRTVNYTDLYSALRDGRIKAAGLNDCNQESVPFKTLFLGLGNCTFLPQSQESVHDVREKVSVGISKSLLVALDDVKRRQQTED